MSEALNLKLWRPWRGSRRVLRIWLGGQAINNGPTINKLEERIAVMRQISMSWSNRCARDFVGTGSMGDGRRRPAFCRVRNLAW
jgi:hypothetical protein